MSITNINFKPTEQPIDLDRTEAKWAEEFGKGIAGDLRKRTEEEMEDYLYLRQHRLRT